MNHDDNKPSEPETAEHFFRTLRDELARAGDFEAETKRAQRWPERLRRHWLVRLFTKDKRR